MRRPKIRNPTRPHRPAPIRNREDHNRRPSRCLSPLGASSAKAWSSATAGVEPNKVKWKKGSTRLNWKGCGFFVRESLSLLESDDANVRIHAVKVVANLAAEDGFPFMCL
ncbi:hypothetical protein NL676_013142 [Syzygium grande]|nr:hypothetical protein NL676_013142 [Syzygium grande]